MPEWYVMIVNVIMPVFCTNAFVNGRGVYGYDTALGWKGWNCWKGWNGTSGRTYFPNSYSFLFDVPISRKAFSGRLHSKFHIRSVNGFMRNSNQARKARLLAQSRGRVLNQTDNSYVFLNRFHAKLLSVVYNRKFTFGLWVVLCEAQIKRAKLDCCAISLKSALIRSLSNRACRGSRKAFFGRLHSKCLYGLQIVFMRSSKNGRNARLLRSLWGEFFKFDR